MAQWVGMPVEADESIGLKTPTGRQTPGWGIVIEENVRHINPRVILYY